MPIPGKQTPVHERKAGPEQKLTKSCRLGINILDVDRINPLLRPKLLNGKVDLSRDRIEVIPDSPEDKILVFTCPPILAALTIDMIRSENRAEGDEVVRAYVCVGDRWKKLESNAILTEPENGQYILNSNHFPIEVEAAPIIPRNSSPIVLGRRPKS